MSRGGGRAVTLWGAMSHDAVLGLLSVQGAHATSRWHGGATARLVLKRELAEGLWPPRSGHRPLDLWRPSSQPMFSDLLAITCEWWHRGPQGRSVSLPPGASVISERGVHDAVRRHIGPHENVM